MRAEHDEILVPLQSFLTAGVPFVLGFRVPTTLSADGLLCNSARSSRFRGGQAAIAAGFDDAIRIGSHKGALLIRSSWEPQWADNGHGGLPYDSLKSSDVAELWSLDRSEWKTVIRDWR